MGLLPALYCLTLGAVVWLVVDPWQVLRWDNLVHNLPLTHEAYRQLVSGRLPVWNPYLWSGSPLLADPQAQTLYPVTWLAFVLAGRTPELALQILYALHVVIGAGGTYVLARTLGATLAGGLLAATVFTLNPFTAYLATSFANEWAVLAWLPWTALASLRAADAARPLGWIALGALGAALAWAAGYPQLWVYAAATTVVLTAGAARRIGRGLVCSVAVQLLGLLVSLHQVLPFLALWRGSQRAALQSVEEFLRIDVPLTSWPAILLPGLVGSVAPSFPLAENNWPHLGLAAVLLALVAAAGRPRRTRLVLLAIAATTLWLAAGDGGGLLRLVYGAVPGIGFLRGPYKFYACTTFAVALLAGLGLGDVQRAPRRRHALALAVAAAIAPIVWARRPDLLPIIGERAGVFPLLALLLGAGGTLALAAVLLRAAARPTPAGAAAIGAAAILATLAGFAPELGIYARPSEVGSRLRATASLLAPLEPQLASDARWYWGVALVSRPLQPDLRRALGARFRLEMATGYSAFLDRGYARAIGQDAATVPVGTRGVSPPFERRNRVLDVLSTRHVLLRRDDPASARLAAPEAATGPPAYEAALPLGDLVLHVRRAALPRVRSVPAVVAVASRDEAILAVQTGRIDPDGVALVEAPEGPAPASAGTCRVAGVQHDAGRIAAEVQCDGPGFLVFAERHDEGWRALVDGVPAPLRRAYGLVLGLAVPAGAHRVELRYAPPGLVAGAVTSALVLALVLAALAWEHRRRGRSTVVESPARPIRAARLRRAAAPG